MAVESSTTTDGGESAGVISTSNGPNGQSSGHVPEPRAEDSAVTKAELLERSLDRANDILDEERPLKRPRLEPEVGQEPVRQERQKGVAPIKPEYE